MTQRRLVVRGIVVAARDHDQLHIKMVGNDLQALMTAGAFERVIQIRLDEGPEQEIWNDEGEVHDMSHEREYAAGEAAARSEIEADGWTRESAASFLQAIGATDADLPNETAYGRGFNASVRRFAQGEKR